MREFKELNGYVMFKEGEMTDFITYGKIITLFPTGVENQYEIKKFNFTSGQYEHTDEFTEWGGNAVTDGFFTVLPSVLEPTQADRLEANTDYIVMMMG